VDVFLANLSVMEKMINLSKDGTIKHHKDFLISYYETKEKKLFESLDCEGWTFEALDIPDNYQKMIDYLASDIDTSLDRDKLLELFNANEVSISGDSKKLITANGKEYKLYMLTTLEVIKFIYDSIKLVLVIEKELSTFTLQNLLRILQTFVTLNNDIVLEGKGFKLKSITPKEISIVCSNLNIIKNILVSLPKYTNDNIFSEIFDSIDFILKNCKSKFTEVYFPQR
jgi:hypothetical protein